MRWIAAVIVTVSGFTGSPARAASPAVAHPETTKSEARALFLQAREAESRGDHNAALGLFAQAFKKDARSRDLCFLYLDRYKAVAPPDSAFSLGKKCLALKGKTAVPELKTLGELALRADDPDAALRYYRDANALKEDDLDVVYVLAGLYEDKQDWDGYAGMVRRLLPRLNYPPALVERQLRAYSALNRPEEALGLLQEAWTATQRTPYGASLAAYYEARGLNRSLLKVARTLAATEPTPEYSWLLAQAYSSADRPDSAVLVAERLLKSPDLDEASGIPRAAVQYFQASLLFDRGRYAEAYAAASNLAKAQSKSSASADATQKGEGPLPSTLYLQGSAALELRKSVARGLLEKALARAPWSPDYRARLAYADYVFKSPEKASARLAYAATDSLKPSEALLLEGIAHGQLARTLEPREPHERPSVYTDSAAAKKHRLEAVARFEQVLTLDSIAGSPVVNTGALFELAAHRERLGERARAAELFRRLLRDDSTHTMTLNYLGYMLIENLPVTPAEIDEAGILLRRAVELDPENGAYLDSRGWWHYRAGALDSARSDLESALESIPSDPAIKGHLDEVLRAIDAAKAARTPRGVR